MALSDTPDQIIEELAAQKDGFARQALLRRPEMAARLGELVNNLVAKVDFYCRTEPAQAPMYADLAELTAIGLSQVCLVIEPHDVDRDSGGVGAQSNLIELSGSSIGVGYGTQSIPQCSGWRPFDRPRPCHPGTTTGSRASASISCRATSPCHHACAPAERPSSR